MSTNVKGEELVYYTKKGEKYHRQSCSYLRSSYSISLKDAVKRYSPCSRCNPPSLSALSDKSSFNSRDSTVQDSNVWEISNVTKSNEISEIENKNKFSGLFGNISSIMDNNNNNSNNFCFSNQLFRNQDNNIKSLLLDRNPFLNKDNFGKEKIEFINQNENLFKKKSNKNENIFSQNNQFFIAKTVNKTNGNQYQILNDNKSKISENTEIKQVLPVKPVKILDNDQDLILTINKIVEQKFAEKESKLNLEVQKLKEKTEQQENQIKILEEKSLKLEVEIAALKHNTKLHDITEDSTEKYPKEINNLNELDTENFNDANLDEKFKRSKIEEPKENLILTENQLDKLTDFGNVDNSLKSNEKKDSNYLNEKIIEIENFIKSTFDKITIIEHALKFQSDINKLNNEKLNYLIGEKNETKLKMENFNNSLNNLIDLIDNIINELKEKISFNMDCELNNLKSGKDKFRGNNVNYKYFQKQENLKKYDMRLLDRSDLTCYDNSIEENVNVQTKTFCISNAIIKDFYKRNNNSG